MTSASTLKQGRNEEKMLKYIVSSAKQISQLYNDIHYSAFSEQDIFLDVDINFKELVKTAGVRLEKALCQMKKCSSNNDHIIYTVNTG